MLTWPVALSAVHLARAAFTTDRTACWSDVMPAPATSFMSCHTSSPMAGFRAPAPMPVSPSTAVWYVLYSSRMPASQGGQARGA